MLLSGHGETQTVFFLFCFFIIARLLFDDKSTSLCAEKFYDTYKMGSKTFSLNGRNTEKHSAANLAICMDVMGGRIVSFWWFFELVIHPHKFVVEQRNT